LRTSNKMGIAALLVFGASLFYDPLVILSGLLFFAMFYYWGREAAVSAIDKAKLEIGSNLKCDDCGGVPHLTEVDNKWLCDGCRLKHWVNHCPVCGIVVSLDEKTRLAHLQMHEDDELAKQQETTKSLIRIPQKGKEEKENGDMGVA
jgi:hypothetical protein